MSKKTSPKKKSVDINKDYSDIMQNLSETVVIEQEWNERGDTFKKYSVYDNYSPVVSFGSTTLLTDI